MKIKYCLTFAAAAIFVFFSQAHCFEVKGLSTPKSFIYDPDSKNYFISNINGFPAVQDRNGFITRLDENGNVIKRDFISSGANELNAPKGMAIAGGNLYVADIDIIRSYDLKTGAFKKEYILTDMDAKFLNDIAADKNGSLYITDTGSNSVYRLDLKKEEISVFVKDVVLAGPSGITIGSDGIIYVASWNNGTIFQIEQKKITRLPVSSFKSIDGIDFDDEGNLYVSDFNSGSIFTITKDKKVTVTITGLSQPADINIDRKNNLILIPEFNKNSAMAIDTKPRLDIPDKK